MPPFVPAQSFMATATMSAVSRSRVAPLSTTFLSFEYVWPGRAPAILSMSNRFSPKYDETRRADLLFIGFFLWWWNGLGIGQLGSVIFNRYVSLGLESTIEVVVCTTPAQAWIFARSRSRLTVFPVRILSRWVPSPVTACTSRISSVDFAWSMNAA